MTVVRHHETTRPRPMTAVVCLLPADILAAADTMIAITIPETTAGGTTQPMAVTAIVRTMTAAEDMAAGEDRPMTTAMLVQATMPPEIIHEETAEEIMDMARENNALRTMVDVKKETMIIAEDMSMIDTEDPARQEVEMDMLVAIAKSIPHCYV